MDGYDFVDVRDVAAGIVSCAEKGVRGKCCLAFGIIAVYKSRRKLAILCNDAILRLFRYGVYGAYIDKLSHTALFADVKNVSCSAHVHPKELCAGLCGDGNYTRAVNYAGAAVCSLEKRRKRIFYTYIADDCMNLFGEQSRIRVIAQHQCVYPYIAAHQLLNDCPTEKTGGAGDQISVIHRESLLEITVQVLTIFHKYSILNIKDKSNRHSQSI